LATGRRTGARGKLDQLSLLKRGTMPSSSARVEGGRESAQKKKERKSLFSTLKTGGRKGNSDSSLSHASGERKKGKPKKKGGGEVSNAPFCARSVKGNRPRKDLRHLFQAGEEEGVNKKGSDHDLDTRRSTEKRKKKLASRKFASSLIVKKEREKKLRGSGKKKRTSEMESVRATGRKEEGREFAAYLRLFRSLQEKREKKR